MQRKKNSGITSSAAVGSSGNRVKKEPKTRRVLEKGSDAFDGCVECGAAESPRWRRGPRGALTLCNVCGLLFAKKARAEVQVVAGEDGG